MQRKLIQLGNETFVVSLPSAWLRQHKLKKGDELEVEEVGPKLAIYPSSELKLGKVTIDVSGTEPVTKRILGALYKAGYNELEIKFESSKELEIIQQTIRESFVGFEILSQTKQFVIAKNVSGGDYEEFDTLLRRVFLLLIEMGNECFKALASDTPEKLQSVALLDNDINRYVNFCRRTLNSVGHKVVTRIAPTYHLVEQLERTGDYYRDLCQNISKSRLVPGSLLKDTLADVNAFVRKFYELYYKFNFESLTEFWKEKERLGKSVAQALDVAKKEELHAVFIISQIVESVAGANGALLTARL